jgi:hypothetical protein
VWTKRRPCRRDTVYRRIGAPYPTLSTPFFIR